MTHNTTFHTLLKKALPDYQLLSANILKGGASAQTTLLDTVSAEGETKKFLVRQHGENDRAMNPNIAYDEYRLLKNLQIHNISASIPIAVDKDTFDFPCIILDYIDGTTQIKGIGIESAMQQMAQALANIHCIPDAENTFSWLPHQSKRADYLIHWRSQPIDDSLSEGIIRETLKSAPDLAKTGKICLLHGDYWENNILWHDGKLRAVIDWEDAMLGNPLADLADARLAILWSYNAEAMQTLTQVYQARMPDLEYSQLAYWDLLAGLRPITQFSVWIGDYDEADMRQKHHWFIKQALNQLNNSDK
ncbi:MAG: hypothetical protein Crog4KO_35170 [Crocinitomicaceae bacterium]